MKRAALVVLVAALAACAEIPEASDPFSGFQKVRSKSTGERIRAVVSDVDTPSYKLRENERDFALVIGIEKYASLPQADYAERDAAAVRKHLVALGYPDRNVVLITGKDAGRAGIEKYVESWLPRNVDEKSKVFVFFSGHGAPAPESGQAYLVPWDGDAQFLETTGYPVKRLYEKLGALKAKSVVVAMDACFSGAGGHSVIAQGTRPLVSKVDTSVGSSDKLAVLAAAGPEEVTGGDDAQGHGIFTYFLLKALNEKQGATTAKAAFDFLSPKVRDAARRQNREQTPQLMAATPELAAVRLDR
jgi:uncharacterized caspase-like protein